jgi:hypothetical protein
MRKNLRRRCAGKKTGKDEKALGLKSEIKKGGIDQNAHMNSSQTK